MDTESGCGRAVILDRVDGLLWSWIQPKKRDLVNQVNLSSEGFNDPIDRKPEDVARDLAWKMTSKRAADKVYGVAVLEDGQEGKEKTQKLGEEIREALKVRRILAKEYGREYREGILKGELPPLSKKSLNLSMKNSEKFYKDFISFWGLEKDLKQIP